MKKKVREEGREKKNSSTTTTTDDVTILNLKSQRAANAKQIKKKIISNKGGGDACKSIEFEESDISKKIWVLPRVSL